MFAMSDQLSINLFAVVTNVTNIYEHDFVDCLDQGSPGERGGDSSDQ